MLVGAYQTGRPDAHGDWGKEQDSLTGMDKPAPEREAARARPFA
jgi:hypothetical protein